MFFYSWRIFVDLADRLVVYIFMLIKCDLTGYELMI